MTVTCDAERELKAAEMLKRELRLLVNDDPELLIDTIEGETQLLEIVDRLLEAIDEATILRLGITKRVEELQARKTRYDAREERFRTLIERAMDVIAAKKLVRPTATLSIQVRPPQVVVSNEEIVPLEYRKIVSSPNKRVILEALKNGEDVPGCTLSNRMESLTIRKS